MIQTHQLQIVVAGGRIAAKGKSRTAHAIDGHQVIGFVVELDQLLLSIGYRSRKEAHQSVQTR